MTIAFPFLAFSAVAPSLLLMWYFHSRDVFPEPARVLWTTFLLGLGTIFVIPYVAAPAEWLAAQLDNPFAVAAVRAFGSAAVPEELGKLLVLVLYSVRHAEFDEPMDGIVYGVAASLGFATLENVMYVSNGGAIAAISRALTAVPSHAFDGAIMGYYLGQARFAKNGRSALLAKAFLIPVAFHGAYDFPLLAAAGSFAASDELSIGLLAGGIGLGLVTLAVLIAEGVWAVRLARGLRTQQLEARAAGQPVVIEPSPAPVGSNRGAWAALIIGLLIASVAGLRATGILVLVLQGDIPLSAGLLHGIAITTPGMVLGVLLFGLGIGRLNRPRSPDADSE